MDRAFRQRLEEAGIDRLAQRLVVGQHREDDVAPGRGFADAAGDLRAAPLELVGLRARPVVDDEVVLAADDPAADCLPHAAKSEIGRAHV